MLTMKQILYRHEIRRSAIKTKDFSGLHSLFGLRSTDLQRKMGNVEFTVGGYDDDPRELWEIPEVIEYFKALNDHWQYAFFFLNTEPSECGGIGLAGFIALLNMKGIQRLPNGTVNVLRGAPSKEQMMLWFDNMNKFWDVYGWDEKLNEKRTEQIFLALTETQLCK